MALNPFINSRGKLRNGWWVALFFVILTALLLPLILISRMSETGVPHWQQAAIILVASLICQALRRRPIAELLGAFDSKWPSQLTIGLALGAALMTLPAAFLAAGNWVTWRVNDDWTDAIGATLLTLAAASAAEELLFRGFLFQRLIDGLGAWPAQLLIAALFTLTHSDALAEIGPLAYLAGANIFVASIMFGLAYLRTRSLALPIGLHFAANVTQGPILGFGVSGNDAAGLLTATPQDAPVWLTGGAFGLEASVPGFVCVAVVTGLLWRWKNERAQHR